MGCERGVTKKFFVTPFRSLQDMRTELHVLSDLRCAVSALRYILHAMCTLAVSARRYTAIPRMWFSAS